MMRGTYKLPADSTIHHVWYSSDPDVQEFVDSLVWLVMTERSLRLKVPKTAPEIFADARMLFGDYRCLDLHVPEH